MNAVLAKAVNRFVGGFRAAALCAAVFVFGQPAIGAEPKPGFKNPIATVCAKLLAPLEDPLRDKKPWVISQQTENKIQELWSDTTSHRDLFQKLALQHDWLLEERLSQTNAISRSFARSAIKNAIHQRSIYSRTLGWIIGKIAGPHYNPVFNRTQQLPIAPALGQSTDIVDLTVSFHELEHAYHRNTRPGLNLLQLWILPFELQFLFLPTPFVPLMQFRMESRALGSQWEYMHRIPVAVRQQLIAQLEQRDALAAMLETAKSQKDADAALEQSLSDMLEDLKIRHGDAGIQHFAQARTLVNQLKTWQGSHISMLRGLIRITKTSLVHAELSKEEFLAKQAVEHNYTLENLIHNHYRFGAIRKYMLFVGSMSVLNWYLHGAHGLPQTQLHDVDFLIRGIGAIWGLGN